eukprot:scaffold48_cov394-Pavlova_lutheri.AAC.14
MREPVVAVICRLLRELVHALQKTLCLQPVDAEECWPKFENEGRYIIAYSIPMKEQPDVHASQIVGVRPLNLQSMVFVDCFDRINTLKVALPRGLRKQGFESSLVQILSALLTLKVAQDTNDHQNLLGASVFSRLSTRDCREEAINREGETERYGHCSIQQEVVRFNVDDKAWDHSFL